MKNLKQILVIIFMLMFTFAPEAQFYPGRSINGHEAVIIFSPFADIGMASFWQIWVVKITGIIYFFVLCLLLAEYVVCTIKKWETRAKLIYITKTALISLIIFRLIFVMCQQSNFYGVMNRDDVFYDYFLSVYLLQLFLAVIITADTDKKRNAKQEYTGNKYIYICYIFLLWMACILPYSHSVTYDIEGLRGGDVYTIFRLESIIGGMVLDFFTSGLRMEQLWIMWLVLAILIGIVNTKCFKEKLYILVHRIMNIITIVFLIYTGIFCIVSQFFNPIEAFRLHPITAVYIGVGVKLLFMQAAETHSCDGIYTLF